MPSVATKADDCRFVTRRLVYGLSVTTWSRKGAPSFIDRPDDNNDGEDEDEDESPFRRLPPAKRAKRESSIPIVDIVNECGSV